jgi:hypothetical protein
MRTGQLYVNKLDESVLSHMSSISCAVGFPVPQHLFDRHNFPVPAYINTKSIIVWLNPLFHYKSLWFATLDGIY